MHLHGVEADTHVGYWADRSSIRGEPCGRWRRLDAVGRGSLLVPEGVPGLPETQAAIAFARERHEGQARWVDGGPFIAHPLEVAALLYQVGASDRVIAAGALHDTIERTSVTASELRRRFGRSIAALVAAVSEDPRIPRYAARKAALREQVAAAGEEALTLFAADKVSKVRELRQLTSANAVGARRIARRGLRLTHYRQCLRMLEDRLPDSTLVRQLAAELSTVEAEADSGTAPDRASRSKGHLRLDGASSGTDAPRSASTAPA